jgi:preprotein translocase subunit SecD
MLHFTRTQTTTILVTVLVICGLSIPNFVSNETIADWPKWTQRRIRLAPELQGGTSVVLEVNQTHVREFVLNNLFHDVRNVLRDARIGSASPLAIRGGSVEVRPLAGDFGAALARLGELSRAFNGVRAAEVTDAGGGLIRVIPTEASIQEYEQPITNRSVGDIRARLFGVPANVEREGPWRVRVQVPRLGPEVFSRLIW